LVFRNPSTAHNLGNTNISSTYTKLVHSDRLIKIHLWKSDYWCKTWICTSQLDLRATVDRFSVNNDLNFCLFLIKSYHHMASEEENDDAEWSYYCRIKSCHRRRQKKVRHFTSTWRKKIVHQCGSFFFFGSADQK